MLKSLKSILGALICAVFLSFSTDAFGVTITYDLNNGSLPTNETEYPTESTNDEIVLANPVYDGHTFVGWCEKSDYTTNGDNCAVISMSSGNWTILTQQELADLETILNLTPGDPDNEIELVAVWQVDDKAITWMLADNTPVSNTTGMDTIYTPGTTTSVAAGSLLTQSSKIFVGWCLNGESVASCAANNTINNSIVTRNIPVDATGDLTFTATWINEGFSVTTTDTDDEIYHDEIYLL